MSGDLILEVNGKDLRTAAYEHVAYTLKVKLIYFLKPFYLIFISLDTSTRLCLYKNWSSKSKCSSKFSSK